MTPMEKHPEEREQQASKLVCSRISEKQKGRGERKDKEMPGYMGACRPQEGLWISSWVEEKGYIRTIY